MYQGKSRLHDKSTTALRCILHGKSVSKSVQSLRELRNVNGDELQCETSLEVEVPQHVNFINKMVIDARMETDSDKHYHTGISVRVETHDDVWLT